jgi:N-acetylglucosamine malate deacetylase 1
MNVLVICAHPDDETIGCGGSLLRHAARGDEIYWQILTKAHEPMWSAECIRIKEREVEDVAAAYGTREIVWSSFPSTKLDVAGLNDVIVAVRDVVARVRPSVVYVVHHGDVHSDHAAVFRATTIVLKPFHMCRFGVRRILAFECLSSTDAAPPSAAGAFVPNVFHDISPYVDRKLAIMALYRSEAQPNPMPRGASALRALARVRGATIGVEYAEAFSIVREID